MTATQVNRDKIYNWICEQAPSGGRVLDIGCGEGTLLARMVEQCEVHGTGIELDEELVVKAVQHGLSVHHGNAEEGMDHYPDDSFDMVVISLAIQEMKNPVRVIREALRLTSRVLISFPNFGNWRARGQLAVLGRAPRTESFPYQWFESPNRHFFTIKDWEDFCAHQGWRIGEKGFLVGGRWIHHLANLRAEIAMYIIVR
ncbi:MAG: methionine biosynthesis protein MetW [Candidatus Sumerlaeota bacterium]